MKESDVEKVIREKYPNAAVYVEDISCSQKKFRVEVTDSSFKDLSLVKRHQAIMDLFKDELLAGKIHGLSLQIGA